MHQIRYRIAMIAAVGLVGCTSLGMKPVGFPTNPWLANDKPCATKECSVDDAVLAIAKAQAFCMDLREYYERGGQVTAGQKLFVGVFGSLAGSVFAITTAGTASKAWAGLSGATNGIQTQIDQTGPRQNTPIVVSQIAAEQLRFANVVRDSLNNAKYTEAVNESVLLPGSCSAAAGQGLKAAADAADAAASGVSAANRETALATAAASARSAGQVR